jgi:hypothetical protein
MAFLLSPACRGYFCWFSAADDHGLDVNHVVGLTLGDLVAAGDVHAGEAIGERGLPPSGVLPT